MHFLPWVRLHSLHFTKSCKAKQRADALCFYPNASACFAFSSNGTPGMLHHPCPPRSPSLCPYPLGQLRVHHEVVNVLLSFGELQLSGHHSHHQGRAAGALQGQQDGGTGGSHLAWSGVGCVGVTGSGMGGWGELWGAVGQGVRMGLTCTPSIPTPRIKEPHANPDQWMHRTPLQPPPKGCTNPTILTWATQFNPSLQHYSASHRGLEQLPELPAINKAD